ncbi:hypothetical protein K1719_033987 [Acacia pycnantha]|nr:hypothetical protein K1719_033987 [Acacia pycnantha]
MATGSGVRIGGALFILLTLVRSFKYRGKEGSWNSGISAQVAYPYWSMPSFSLPSSAFSCCCWDPHLTGRTSKDIARQEGDIKREAEKDILARSSPDTCVNQKDTSENNKKVEQMQEVLSEAIKEMIEQEGRKMRKEITKKSR